VLRRAEARAPLLEALGDCDRLVLLGDVLELRHGPLRGALDEAAPVLQAIGSRLGPEREVVVVPGNHDHLLLRAWQGRGSTAAAPHPLGLAAEIDWREDEPLASVVELLAPARVRVRYPGTWIRDDVYAIHGHYCDRHTTVPILERLGAGVMGRVVSEPDGGPRRAEDYEATLAPMYAWIDTVAQNGGVAGRGGGSLQIRAWHALQRPEGSRTVRGVAVGALFGGLIAVLNRARIGPLGSDTSGVQLRRAALRAFAEVIERLGVQAPYVIFGHTHRAGPLPGDDLTEWVRDGGPAMLNTGSWIHEAGFMGNSPRRSPYRPGFCAMVEDEGAPELVNLLDGGPA